MKIRVYITIEQTKKIAAHQEMKSTSKRESTMEIADVKAIDVNAEIAAQLDAAIADLNQDNGILTSIHCHTHETVTV